MPYALQTLITATAGYMVKQFGETGDYNLYLPKCNNFGIFSEQHTCKGIRWDCYQTLWTERRTIQIKILRKRHISFFWLMRCLNVSYLTESGYKFMDRFTRYQHVMLNSACINLVDLIKDKMLFYKGAKVSLFHIVNIN